MGEAVVELLSPMKFDLYWPAIKAELETVPHVWNLWWTLESIQEYSLNGRFQCWAAGTKEQIRLVLFTQVSTFPASRVLELVFAFGQDWDRFEVMLATVLERYAIGMSCTLVETTGRRGWGPRLKRQGFVRHSERWVKPLKLVRMN